MKPILLFDVNETLLNLSALDLHFERIFGNTAVRQEWFSQVIQSALVKTVTNSYYPFGKIALSALDMVAERKGINLLEVDKNTIFSGLVHLPPHEEVVKSLEKLDSGGFIIAALTNSTKEVAEKQLRNAKIIQFFDKIFSADEVRRLKPAKEVYEYAAKELDVQVSNAMLIAAHSWDIAGALRAGCAAAFIQRPGMVVLDPLGERPDIIGKDLMEVADQIIEKVNIK